MKSLSLGRQLHWREESSLLFRFPDCDLGGDNTNNRHRGTDTAASLRRNSSKTGRLPRRYAVEVVARNHLNAHCLPVRNFHVAVRLVAHISARVPCNDHQRCPNYKRESKERISREYQRGGRGMLQELEQGLLQPANSKPFASRFLKGCCLPSRQTRGCLERGEPKS